MLVAQPREGGNRRRGIARHQLCEGPAVNLREREVRIVLGERVVVRARINPGGRVEYPHPLLDDRVAHAVGREDGGTHLVGAATCLGNARARDRVRAQQFRNPVRPELGAPAHGVEEARHRRRIESGRVEQADADTVRFVLVLAREVDLRLDGEVLRRGHCAHRRVGAAARHRADQDRSERGGGGHQVRTRLVLEAARDVPLRDVRHLVREHGRELALLVRLEQQPGVDADEPAGQGERVDRGVADQEEIEVAVAVVGEAREAQAQRLHVLADLGVFHDRARVAQAAHDHAADAVLVLEAERGLGGRAHLGQLVLHRLGVQGAGQQQPGRETESGKGGAEAGRDREAHLRIGHGRCGQVPAAGRRVRAFPTRSRPGASVRPGSG